MVPSSNNEEEGAQCLEDGSSSDDERIGEDDNIYMDMNAGDFGDGD